jgi:HSP20 family protein
MSTNLMPWNSRPSLLSGRISGDPFYSLQNDINNLLEDFVCSTQPAGLLSNDFSPAIPVDIVENDKNYKIEAELPGMKAENVDVSFTNNSCTIKCKKEEYEEDKGQNYLRRERAYGSCQRTISLPEGVNPDKADATFKNGILQIQVPKRPEASVNVKRIKIQAA